MESMEQVFDQCQQLEEKRLSFLREVLLDVKRHLNLTENQRFDSFKTVRMLRHIYRLIISPHTKSLMCFHSYATVYRELERTIMSASPQEDLKWFSNTNGPGMHMNWPQFEVQKYSSFRSKVTPKGQQHNGRNICSVDDTKFRGDYLVKCTQFILKYCGSIQLQ